MEKRTINGWVTDIHEYAKAKGWWSKPRTPLEIHMLCVSELAEATEEVRNAKPPLYKVLKADSGYKLDKPEVAELGVDTICYPDSEGFKLPGKIEGEAAELADCVIRIMDYFGKQGWDLEEVIRLKHEYNLTRPYRHGGKTA